jgi:hypothetical protein
VPAAVWVRYLNQLIAWCERDENGRWHPLPIAGRELDQFAYGSLSRQLLAVPGFDVIHTPGALHGQQLASQRASYINALLIQSRGYLLIQDCDHCMEMDVRRPFPFCVRMPGYFGGACGNCKWPDKAHRCSVRDGQPGNAVRPRAVRPALPQAPLNPSSGTSSPTASRSGSSSQNPIHVPDTGDEGDPITISSSDDNGNEAYDPNDEW